MRLFRTALLAEDDPLVRAVLSPLMEEMVDRVVAVESGCRAMQMLSTDTFDLVVTDLRMPGADGIEVIRAAKAKSATTKLVVVSGYADEESQQVLEDLGAQVLHKPFGAAELRAALSRVTLAPESPEASSPRSKPRG